MSQTIKGIDKANDRFGTNELQYVRAYKLETFGGATFECRAILCRETVGYSAFVSDLPGVVSEGDTLEDAVNNIRDAFRETLLSYRDEGREIPWVKVDMAQRPEGSMERWIIVNV